VRQLVILQGGMTQAERRDVAGHLARIPDSEPRLVLATGRYIGEGFDDARLDTLFLTMPVSWKGTLVQYAGRLHRLHPGKTEVRIYDYVDREVPLFVRMFEKRLRGYRAIGTSETTARLVRGPAQTSRPMSPRGREYPHSPSRGGRVGQDAAGEAGKPHRQQLPHGDRRGWRYLLLKQAILRGGVRCLTSSSGV
jgi:superfamily II DNA or RNA helicase